MNVPSSFSNSASPASGGLLLGIQVLLLADPVLLPFPLLALARQPVDLAPLAGQALLPRREAPAPGYISLVCVRTATGRP
jgi:hypothetical protein